MGNPRVLVIDDDLAVREAISAGLRLDGYDLIFAENGADALAALKRSTPRVVILDLKMPVMDGLEFLSNVQLDHSGAIAVVVLTAYVDDDSVEACFNAGITALVRKPFILNELRGAVQAAITHREQTRLLNEMLVERVVAGLAQDKVSRRLDINGQRSTGTCAAATKPFKPHPGAIERRPQRSPEIRQSRWYGVTRRRR